MQFRSLLVKFLLALGLLAAACGAQAQSCESRLRVSFADGSRDCLDRFGLENRKVYGAQAPLVATLPRSGVYALALPQGGPACPAVVGAWFPAYTGPQEAHLWAQEAVGACERGVRAQGGNTAAGCGCKAVVRSQASDLSRDQFTRMLASAPPQAPQVAAASPAPAPPEPVVVAEPPPPPVAPAPIAPVAVPASPPPAAAATTAAAVSRRTVRALVIGNSAYAHFGKLPNPRSDAQAIAAKFRGFGMEVDLVLDADRDTLIKALNDYSSNATGRDVNILYYAGHGVQVDGVNYIVPVNMRADAISPGYVKLAGVSLNAALDYLPAATRLVFLDACRDNPASRSLVAGNRGLAATGLAPVQATRGTFIAYATKEGATADDGKGAHSPYTAALLEHLDAPQDIGVVMRRVRQSVLKATSNRQEPWEYGSLVGDELVLSRIAKAR